jgi:hypothetical protein
MLRIIGRTIEHVIGRSSKELEGVEAEAIVAVSAEDEANAVKIDDFNVNPLDIIDASGFLHKGSAISSKFRVDVGAQDRAETSRSTVSASEITATVLKLEQECSRCGVAFTWFGTRRHHCRSCWRAFCADHCSKKAQVQVQRVVSCCFTICFSCLLPRAFPALTLASGSQSRPPGTFACL